MSLVYLHSWVLLSPSSLKIFKEGPAVKSGIPGTKHSQTLVTKGTQCQRSDCGLRGGVLALTACCCLHSRELGLRKVWR